MDYKDAITDLSANKNFQTVGQKMTYHQKRIQMSKKELWGAITPTGAESLSISKLTFSSNLKKSEMMPGRNCAFHGGPAAKDSCNHQPVENTQISQKIWQNVSSYEELSPGDDDVAVLQNCPVPFHRLWFIHTN